MDNNDYLNNSLFVTLVENSIFTKKQMQIIYKTYMKSKRPMNISSGAYYREVKQSKSKIYKLIYSLILLELLNILDPDQLITITSIVEQLRQLQENHNNYHTKDLVSILNVIEVMISRIIRL
ncbi:MAG: hypothetical protein AB7V56_14035 [Candidatus Nitrosocosmicus sp.]|nr:hypothetical protein [Candidatus Nitrosocosmicus sp.]